MNLVSLKPHLLSNLTKCHDHLTPHQEIPLSPGDHPYRVSYKLPSLRLDTAFHNLVLFAATCNVRKSLSLLRRRCIECTDTSQRSFRCHPTTKNGELVYQMTTYLLAGKFLRCQRIQKIDTDGFYQRVNQILQWIWTS